MIYFYGYHPSLLTDGTVVDAMVKENGGNKQMILKDAPYEEIIYKVTR